MLQMKIEDLKKQTTKKPMKIHPPKTNELIPKKNRFERRLFHFFIFTPILGEDSHFDDHIFQMGWFNHQLETMEIYPLRHHPKIFPQKWRQS